MVNKVFVDAITLSRILFSVILVTNVMKIPNSLMLTTVLFSVIFLSDFIDGKMARRLSVASRAGAVMDVFADLFYIVTICFALLLQGIFPAWMMAVIIGKFAEFWCTSAIAKKEGICQNNGLLFDRMGRMAAAMYYILPFVVVLLNHYMLRMQAISITKLLCVVITVITVISSIGRIRNMVWNQREKMQRRADSDYHKTIIHTGYIK